MNFFLMNEKNGKLRLTCTGKPTKQESGFDIGKQTSSINKSQFSHVFCMDVIPRKRKGVLFFVFFCRKKKESM